MQPTTRSRTAALLGGLLLTISAVAGAQGASATDAIEEQAATRVAAAVCSKRMVVLGELPEHGEARVFGIKARVVERLVGRCGFRAVLFEAGSYDFFGLQRAIAAPTQASASTDRTDSLELALARAIGGFWWTRELAPWRRWLLHEVLAGRVTVGGIDDQPSATAAYARATLPDLVGAASPPARAAECKAAVTRYLTWGYTTSQPYDSTEQTRLADCTRLAAYRGLAARKSERGTPDSVMLANIASHFARERGNAARGNAPSPDREVVMARSVAWWAARLPNDTKIIVWTATKHAARASGSQAELPAGAPTLGAQLADRWGDRLAVIGFTALQGEWGRAGGRSQPLATLPPNALEAQALARDSVEWTYLDSAKLHELGAVPSRLFGTVVTADWSTAFDGILVVRTEAAPTFEARR